MRWRGIPEGVCLVRLERQRCVCDQHKKFDPRWVVMEERFSPPPPPPPAAMRSRPTELVSGSLGSPPSHLAPPLPHYCQHVCAVCVYLFGCSRAHIRTGTLCPQNLRLWTLARSTAGPQIAEYRFSARGFLQGWWWGRKRMKKRRTRRGYTAGFFPPPSFFLYVFRLCFAREKHFPVKYTTLAQTNTPAVPKHTACTLSEPTRVGLHCTRTDCRCLCTIAQTHNSVWTT